MKILAIIPARGGSKGLPRKNILPLSGKPLIAHTIEAARLAGCFDRIIVTTDDAEIAEVAKQYGAEVPFIRSPELSNDLVSGTEVAIHAVEQLALLENYRPDIIIYLQPTSPLRSPEDIREAVALHQRSGAPVIGLKLATEFPQWMRRIGEDGRVSVLFPELEQPDSRQQMPPAYLINGSIYVTTRVALLENKSLCNPPPVALVMPENRSVDIDTLDDLRRAEWILQSSQTRFHAQPPVS